MRNKIIFGIFLIFIFCLSHYLFLPTSPQHSATFTSELTSDRSAQFFFKKKSIPSSLNASLWNNMFRDCKISDLNPNLETLKQMSSLQIKNIHFRNINSEHRLQWLAADESQEKFEFKYFTLDQDGLPLPQKIPDHLKNLSGTEVVDYFILKLGRPFLEQTHWILKDTSFKLPADAAKEIYFGSWVEENNYIQEAEFFKKDLQNLNLEIIQCHKTCRCLKKNNQAV